MKKLLLFVSTLVCLAVVYVLVQDSIEWYVKTFKDAFGEVKQWENLM